LPKKGVADHKQYYNGLAIHNVMKKKDGKKREVKIKRKHTSELLILKTKKLTKYFLQKLEQFIVIVRVLIKP
jgi:hypothetical protein